MSYQNFVITLHNPQQQHQLLKIHKIMKLDKKREKINSPEKLSTFTTDDEELKNIYVVSSFEYFIVFFYHDDAQPFFSRATRRSRLAKRMKFVRCTCEA